MQATLAFDRGTLLLSPPDLPAAMVPSTFVKDPRAGGRFRGLANTYRTSLAQLIRAGIDIDDQARQYVTLNLAMERVKTPYPHQKEALDAWEKHARFGVVVLPTGAGKTYVAEMAIERTQRSTLVVAPTLDLVAQWARGLAATFGTPVGTIGGGSFDVQPLTVSTYDSAYLHMDRLGNQFGLIVFDEVHHLPSESYSQAATLSLAPYRLGLTATPERPDQRHEGITDLVGPIVYRKRVSDLSGEYLSDYNVIRVHVDLTPEEREQYEESRAQYREFVQSRGIRMGSPRGWQRFIEETCRSAEGRAAFQAYRKQRQLALASTSKLQAFEKLLHDHPNEKVLFFAHSNRTVYSISQRFLVPAITHETSTAERQTILNGLEAGRWHVVGTSRVLNEGVDMPDVSVGVVMSGTGSVREHVQRLGRILRRKPGKRAVLYELVTRDTIDTYTSQRRRDHEAYR
jgi:superfamily II DNA or RNA helicase